jgi:uncharacterized protein (DUF2141 family)
MYKFIVLLVAVLLPSVIYSQNNKTTGSLTFNVIGFADNSGQLLVHLFHKEDKVPTHPFKQIKAAIINKKADVIIENLPYGDYAAIFVYDKNSNGKIDHRLGIPCEPLGYTNNWKLSLFSGMPSFSKLKFTFSASQYHFTIKMPE